MDEILQILWAQLPQHGALFVEAKRRYGQLCRMVIEEQANERWATGPAFSLEPFGIERMSGGPAGRLLKSSPSRCGTKARLCFNASGEVICERRYNPDGTCYEEFVERTPDVIRTTLFDYYSDKDVINVQSLHIDNNVPTSFVRFAVNGSLVEHYVFREGRVVEATTASQDSASPQARLFLTKDTFDYDGLVLKTVSRTWDTGERQIIYPRKRG